MVRGLTWLTVHMSALSSVISSQCPRVVSRAEWGARPPAHQSDPLPDLLPMVFVHHRSVLQSSPPTRDLLWPAVP